MSAQQTQPTLQSNNGRGSKTSLAKVLVAKIYELQKMLLEQKIRKPFDYNRHGKKDFTAVLEPGDIITLEPFETYLTHFMIANNSVPELLTDKEINLVTANGNVLPTYTQTTTLTPTPVSLDTLDMDSMYLGLYYFVVLDPLIYVTFNQPGPNARFTDKTTPINFSLKNTLPYFLNKDYGKLPQMAVFGNTTTIKVNVTSYNPNSNTRYARLLAFGYKYKLDAVKLNDKQDRNDPRVVTTFNTGGRTRS